MPRVTPDSGGTTDGAQSGTQNGTLAGATEGRGAASASPDLKAAMSNFLGAQEQNTAPGMEVPDDSAPGESAAPAPSDPRRKVGQDHARPAPQTHRGQGGKFVPTPTPQPRAPRTQRPEDAADQQGETQQPDAMANFRQAFGLPEGVDAAAAHGEILDDFDRTLEQARAQRGSVVEVDDPFQPQIQQRQPQRPAGQQAQQNSQQTQPTRDYAAIEAEFGKTISDTIRQQDEALASLRQQVEQTSGQFRQTQERQAQQAAQRAQQSIEGFFAKQPGFEQLVGLPGKRNRAMQGAIMDLVEDAAIYQQAKAQRGIDISDEQALQASWNRRFAEQMRQTATADARGQIETQIRNRHRGLDVLPGGSGNKGAAGEWGSKQALETHMGRFLAGNGARR